MGRTGLEFKTFSMIRKIPHPSAENFNLTFPIKIYGLKCRTTLGWVFILLPIALKQNIIATMSTRMVTVKQQTVKRNGISTNYSIFYAKSFCVLFDRSYHMKVAPLDIL